MPRHLRPAHHPLLVPRVAPARQREIAAQAWSDYIAQMYGYDI
jgi:hypothetical protein